METAQLQGQPAMPLGGYQNLNRSIASLLIALAVVSLPYVHTAVEPLYVTVLVDTAIDEVGVLVSIHGHVTGLNQSSVALVSVSIQVNDPYGSTVHIALVHSDSSGEYSDAFQLPSSRPRGYYQIYVTASKPGFEDAYAKLTFAVEFTPFSISVSPQALEVGRGKTAIFRIVLESRGRSSSPVQVDVVGLPSHVSYSLSSNNQTVPSVIELKLETSEEVMQGSYTFTVIGRSNEGEARANAEIIIVETKAPVEYVWAPLLAAAVLAVVIVYWHRKRKMRKKAPSSAPSAPEYLNGLALSPSTLVSLPDHLRKTAVIVCQLGEASAVEVAARSGRARAAESDYLNQLVRMGLLKKKRKGRESYFTVE
jgi:hypothetical protein